MATRFNWTDEIDKRIRYLASKGHSVRYIADEIGISKSAIDRRIQKLGIILDRTGTEAATKANTVDAAARRAALQVALLDDAQKLREQLWKQTTIYSFGGKDNTYNERTVDRPPFGDQLKIMQATGVAVDKSLKLADFDSGGAAEKVVGLLQATASALGLTDEQGQQP